MASRFGASALHQRDPRSALFENYDGGGGGGGRGERPRTASPAAGYNGGYGYGYQGGVNGSTLGVGGREREREYRPATPNSRGQYSDATLNELESQNDGQVEGMLGKVKQLKDLTIGIGEEIRHSSALAEKMNDQFDNAQVRLRGTINRMLLMAQKTGIPWKVWLAFFAAVIILFWYVWLF